MSVLAFPDNVTRAAREMDIFGYPLPPGITRKIKPAPDGRLIVWLFGQTPGNFVLLDDAEEPIQPAELFQVALSVLAEDRPEPRRHP